MNSRVITSSDIGWIVKIMCKSTPLVRGRESLCLALGLSSSHLTDIERDRDKTAGTHGYLVMALNLWIPTNCETTIENLVEVLRGEGLNKTAGEISKKQTEHPPKSATNDQNFPSVWFDVPEDVHMFTGRVEQLKELHESIIGQHDGDEKNDMTVITAVSGMGGVGKTSLTIHYAWTFFKIFYVNVIWINSETRNTIADSFNRLARRLGQSVSLEFCDVVSGIYENIGKEKTLIIFDNVECYEDFKTYIPVRAPNAVRPYVLLSSRNRNWHFRTHLIDLDVFRADESVEFMKSFLSLRTESELVEARAITDALQNLPLALRQAGAYIKMQYRENGKPIVEGLQSYLHLFKSNSIETLTFDHSSHTADIYEKTIFTTWTVNMEKLTQRNRLTQTIVELISYLNSDNIPIKLFYNIPEWVQGGFLSRLLRLSRNSVEISDVNSAVKLLADFSLIKRMNPESISVHRLLQKVVRTQVQQKYKGSQLDWVIDLIQIPLQLNNYDNYEDICLLHALSIMEQTPSHLVQRRRMKFFLELVENKQNNSISNNLNLLQNLVNKDKFDDALKSFEKSRKLYLAQGMSTKTPIDQLFVLRFLNLICLEILRECDTRGINTRTLELVELVKNIFFVSNISLDDEASMEDAKILGKTLLSLYETAIVIRSTDLIGAKNEIYSTVYFILGALFGNIKTIFYYSVFTNTYNTMFCGLVEMQALAEIKRFLERLVIFLILSNQSDSQVFTLVAIQKATDNILKKLKDSGLLRADME